MSGPRLLTIQVVCQQLWVIPGIIGALAGQIIPPDVQGMEFALNALFIVLAYEALQSSRDFGAVVLEKQCFRKVPPSRVSGRYLFRRRWLVAAASESLGRFFI